jgi:hypothetical protein
VIRGKYKLKFSIFRCTKGWQIVLNNALFVLGPYCGVITLI